jgi:hypothetical protein
MRLLLSVLVCVFAAQAQSVFPPAGGTGSGTVDVSVFGGQALSSTAIVFAPGTKISQSKSDNGTTATITTSSTEPVVSTIMAANCQLGAAATGFTLPSSNYPASTCLTGSNSITATLDFDADTDESVEITLPLKSTWAGTIALDAVWIAAATTGSAVWAAQTKCVASAGESLDAAYNDAQTVTDAAQGTTLYTNTASIASLTVTGCAAGETLFLKFYRDANAGADDMTGDARLWKIILTM